MTEHAIGTRQEWLAARTALLAEEKELTRRSDELARKRHALPWVAVEKDYRFQTDGGTKTLVELFDRRPQLLVYHFMFGPTVDGWPDSGCPGCSYTADSLDGAVAHLPPRGVTFVAVSRAPPREAARVQAPDGLELPVGFGRGRRLQPRLRRLHRRRPQDRHRLQLRHPRTRRGDRPAARGAPRPQRLRARGAAWSTTPTRATTAAPTL